MSLGFERKFGPIVGAVPLADQIVMEGLLNRVGDELLDHCVCVPILYQSPAHYPLTPMNL
jgi:hypothetical protein